MVAKKAKSKRIVASKRYKIEKKVNEAHRKQRKEARLNPVAKKMKKDPGIPNMFPFKEKLLLQAEATKVKIAEEKERQKEARAKLQSKNRGMSADQSDLAQMAREAFARSQAFDHTQSIHSDGFSLGNVVDAAAAGMKDNSRKAYYKEFKKVVENADVILEVLDARDPLGCRTRQIEELILNAGADKRVILILNKIDLVPREVVEQWLKYLRNEFPTIAFKASTQSQRNNLGQSSVSFDIASDRLLGSSECLGADNLMKLLKNYCRNANIKTSITVGVIGFPNVGKSSVINSLKRSKVCNVGATPGVTKVAQTIQLDKGIKLLDCPGIVFSQSSRDGDEAEVLLRNCVKVELLEDPVSPVEVIVGRCKKEQLMRLYNLPMFGDTRDFLVQVARQRGKLRKGGIPDVESAARAVLQDWNSGRIPFYTVPPQAGIPVNSHVSSSIVASWAQEFELPEIVETEGKELQANFKGKGQVSTRMLAIAAGTANEVDMNVDALPAGYASGGESEDMEDAMEVEDDEEESDEESDEAPDLMDISASQPPTSSSSAGAIQSEIRFREPATRLASAKKRVEKHIAALNAAETELNPQVNQNKKKQLKAKRKQEKKAGKGAMASMEVDDDAVLVDEKYDFAEHFAAATLPGDDSDDDL
ncbi:Guanine nucleotide-binding protein-like 3 [Geranomyces variabilis]|nr:Guanine nucleotide-binding protein-like 3 [Geranomyces variabilis]